MASSLLRSRSSSWLLSAALAVLACGKSPAPATAPGDASTATGGRQPDASLIPRDVLFGNPERATPRISPDGTQLMFLAPVNGVTYVLYPACRRRRSVAIAALAPRVRRVDAHCVSVDGYRFLDHVSRLVMRAWERREPRPAAIPWTPLPRPLAQCRVALVSTAGLARRDDVPFDQAGERANPWWGDPSFRVLPREVTEADVEVYHLHIDPRPARRDLNCVLPLRRLDELVARGEVGSVAAQHYSIMGYALDTTVMERDTAPALARALRREAVDLALLVPV